MIKRLLIKSFAAGFLAVAFGALGAHKLKELISLSNLEIFEKAVRYQFYHVFAMITSAVLLKLYDQKTFYYAGMFFFGGIICFSGSLYLFALREIQISSANVLGDYLPATIIGPVTPIGGLLFLAGWGLLLKGVLKIKS